MNVRDATLTRTEKNEVFAHLVGGKFDPNEFVWTEDEKKETVYEGDPLYRSSKLIHRPTDYYFIFGFVFIEFSPGVKSKVQIEGNQNTSNFRASFLNTWLSRLRKEIDAPDLWASIGKEKVLSNAASSPDLGDKPFNADERGFIAAKLDQLKGYILEGQAFDAEQAEKIEREFAYLHEASQRLGRKDWLTILLGGLFGLMLTLALPPEKARGLLALAGTLFQSLWDVTQRFLQ